MPDPKGITARDRMSQRAVLAHEYYGHYLNHPSEYPVGHWRDEFRASYDAAVKAPNLTDEDAAAGQGTVLCLNQQDRGRFSVLTRWLKRHRKMASNLVVGEAKGLKKVPK